MTSTPDLLSLMTGGKHRPLQTQVTAATKAAGVGNPGSATSRGYVAKTAAGKRAITPKGVSWLQANGYDVA